MLQISSESQVFWDLKYSIPALFGVEKFGKYFLASLNEDGICEYSRLPIIWTFKGNRKKFKLLGVRVIECKIIWKMIWKEMKITLS